MKQKVVDSGQLPTEVLPMMAQELVPTNATKLGSAERSVAVTSVSSVTVKRYQSVSRVSALAQKVPCTVSPSMMSVQACGLLLQPPLTSAPHSSGSRKSGVASSQPPPTHTAQLALAALAQI